VSGIKNPPEKLQIGVKKRIEPCPTAKTKKGDKVQMHYRGTLFGSDEEFDSSFSRNKPFEFTLGVGQVIQGWDLGLMGMCPGEQRKLVIPPGDAYGERG
jgi:FKBP-type peptidyl-prolyl cis-trans isomerase